MHQSNVKDFKVIISGRAVPRCLLLSGLPSWSPDRYSEFRLTPLTFGNQDPQRGKAKGQIDNQTNTK